MKNIKFRAWDKFNGCYYYSDRYENLAKFFALCQACIDGNNELVFEQFTGLKDKNWKEIYEGDMFREEEETDNGDILKYHVVMWIPQRAAFYLININHYLVLLDNDCSEEEEFEWLFSDACLYDFYFDVRLSSGIIGNIHENPELLTQPSTN